MRERESQNQAVKDILQGGDPKKKIMISTIDISEIRKERIKKEREQSAIAGKRLDAIKEVFVCVECGGDVRWGSRLDRKMQAKIGKCFNCVIVEENKMIINGTFKKYEKMKVLQNKLSIAKEQRVGMVEFRDKPAPEFYNQRGEKDVEKEKWSMNVAAYKKLANEAIDDVDTVIEVIEEEIKILEEII